MSFPLRIYSKNFLLSQDIPICHVPNVPNNISPQVIKEDPLIANHPSTWTRQPSNPPSPFFTGASIWNERRTTILPTFRCYWHHRWIASRADMTRQLPEESIDLERYVASDQLSGAGMVAGQTRATIPRSCRNSK